MQTGTIKNLVAGDAPSCNGMSLSGDGRRLFRTCAAPGPSHVEVFDAPNWALSASVPTGEGGTIDSTADGRRFVTWNLPQRAVVFSLVNGAWVQDRNTLTFGAYRGSNFHTGCLAISRDGKFVVGGNQDDVWAGHGQTYPPFVQTAGPRNGGAYVWELKPSGWRLRVLIKPNTEGTRQAFGQSVAMGDNGRTLAVGAWMDSSAALGIGGDQEDTSAPERGAVWLY
jgi:hypothetical protein